MKYLVPLLTVLFHMLEIGVTVLVFPFACLCALGLIAFTSQIAFQLRMERSRPQMAKSVA